jgi:hypothetical protein
MPMLDSLHHQLSDVLTYLQKVPLTDSGEPDWAAADPVSLCDMHAAITATTEVILEGLAAIGMLYGHTAPSPESRELSVKAIFIMQAQLCDLLREFQNLASVSLAYISDYKPSGPPVH